MFLGLDQRFSDIIQTQLLSVPALSHLLCIGCSLGFSFSFVRWCSRHHTRSNPKARRKVTSGASLCIKDESFSQEPPVRLSPQIPAVMIKMYTDVLVVRQAGKIRIWHLQLRRWEVVCISKKKKSEPAEETIPSLSLWE